jgi:soluble lytic murein transglycosylase-like protein
MDPITLTACALFFKTPANIPCTPPRNAPAQTTSLGTWRSLIDEAAAKFHIPRTWIEAVMQRESGGQTTRNGYPITSPAGAMGLMQVMPDTFAEMRVKLDLGADPYDPHDNIFAGVGYLRELYSVYGFPNLFAAYNAGPRRLDEFLFTGKPLPDETESYLDAVISSAGLSAETRQNRQLNDTTKPRQKRKHAGSDGLFFDQSATDGADDLPSRSDGLFVFRALDKP